MSHHIHGLGEKETWKHHLNKLLNSFFFRVTSTITVLLQTTRYLDTAMILSITVDVYVNTNNCWLAMKTSQKICVSACFMSSEEKADLSELEWVSSTLHLPFCAFPSALTIWNFQAAYQRRWWCTGAIFCHHTNVALLLIKWYFFLVL